MTRDPVLAWTNHARRAAQQHGIPLALLLGLVKTESGGDPRAVSPAGAQGLGQLMPRTAAGLGVRDSFDPAQNLDGTARYLRAQLDTFGGDIDKALAAYNAGPGAVQRYDGIPPYPETRAYVAKVKAAAKTYGTLDTNRPTSTARPPQDASPAAGAGENPLSKHSSGARNALLTVGLVSAGATLLYLGIARTAGIQHPIRTPARAALTAVPAGRAAAAAKKAAT